MGVKVRRLSSARSGGVFRTLGVVGLLLVAPLSMHAADQSEPADLSLYERVRFGLAHLGQAGLQGEQAAVQWLGTAFVVDESCNLATAKHALARIPEDQLVLRFLGREEGTVRTYPGRIVHLAEDNDLAFITFGPSKKGKRWCRSEGFQPIPIHAGSSRVELTGESVVVLGYPAIEGMPPRDLPVLRGGAIASAELDWEERPMLLLDLTGVPGFSGAPVILESSGEAVGVVYGPGRTERVYDLEWATPLNASDHERWIREARR